MTMKTASRLTALLVAALLFAASCSGSDANTTRSPEEQAAANAPATQQIDEGSGGVTAGPIEGLLSVQPSFGFGLFVIDPDTGLASALPGIASVESVDRNNDVILSDGAAYALGSKVREGQTFAADISVIKVDYATGVVTQVAPLGPDRETDESESLTSYRLVAVAGDSVVVRTSEFGSGEGTYTVFNADSGNQEASFAEPRFEIETDTATCGGGVSDLIGLSDGRLAGTALDGPAIVDLSSGEIDPFLACGEDDPSMDDFITTAQVGEYVVFNEGPAPTEEQLARLINTDLEPEQGFVEGGGDLWWIEANVRVVDELRATVGGVVQFDLATGAVEAVHPLSAHLAEYTDCGPDSEDCSVSTLGQAQMRYLDGQLFIVDTRENGRLLTLDVATSDIRVTEFERGDGVDYTDADLLEGDANDIWLEVRRMTITKDDETGRLASGPSFIERLDPSTGQIVFSAKGEDLFLS